jgi:hypothetical protein
MSKHLFITILIATILFYTNMAGSAELAKSEETKSKIDPKPLSENVQKGLTWLINHQQEDGGWAQGEESEQMGHSLDKVKDVSNVADTCMALFALIRSGSTPTEGSYKENVIKGLNFVCSEVEKADKESLFITSVKGTRVQAKIGTYIDTFLAGTILAEMKDKMPDEAGNKRILAALDKTMDKIERNQKDDGTWENKGWATDLSQSMASRSINTATQKGVKVSEKVRAKTEKFANQQYDVTNGSFKRGAGAAGVELYNAGLSVNSMLQSDTANETKRADLENQVKNGATEKEREEAKQTLARYDDNKRALDKATSTIVKKVEDKQFISGFGSNGGEEFLSYLNIGEALVAKGGDDWKKWDESMTKNLNNIQNADGTWTGHHCITGRTFCTSAALLVLTIDRAPMQLSKEIKGK